MDCCVRECIFRADTVQDCKSTPTTVVLSLNGSQKKDVHFDILFLKMI